MTANPKVLLKIQSTKRRKEVKMKVTNIITISMAPVMLTQVTEAVLMVKVTMIKKVSKCLQVYPVDLD